MGSGAIYIVEAGTVRCEKYALGGGHVYEILQRRGGARLSLFNLELDRLSQLVDLVKAEDVSPGSAGVHLVDAVYKVPEFTYRRPGPHSMRRMALERSWA